MIAEGWAALTLGDALGYLLGGGGLALVGRVVLLVPRTLQAYERHAVARTLHLEATTATAREQARMAPLLAEGLRAFIRKNGGKVPVVEDDSDELRVMRVVADGDDRELAEAVELLAGLDEGSTLNRKLTRGEQRIVEMMAAARRRRADPDAPRPHDGARDRAATSWWPRKASR